MAPHGRPPARRGQQICAEKPLVTSDGRPVTVTNVLINSCKNDAISLFISRSAFLYSVHCSSVLLFTLINVPTAVGSHNYNVCRVRQWVLYCQYGCIISELTSHFTIMYWIIKAQWNCTWLLIKYVPNLSVTELDLYSRQWRTHVNGRMDCLLACAIKNLTVHKHS